MKKRILLKNNISSIIYNNLPTDRYDVGQDVEDPNGIIVRSAKMHDEEFNPSLLGIARAGVGYNNIPVERCTEAGICVFNTPGANANAVKEIVLGSMIMSYRNMTRAIEWAKTLEGQDDITAKVEEGKKQFVGPEIYGKKLGLIGLGAIGTLVANDAYSLGMQVYGYDPFMSVESAWALRRHIHRATSIEELVAECDIISIHVPLSEKTRYALNAELFAKMKKGAVLLNFSRAELVDTEAMLQALADKTLHSYVTDFPTEETVGAEGVINIPHLGASTPESEENCADMASKQMYDYLQTGNIKNSVNLPDCYMAPYEGGRITCVHRNVPGVVGKITNILAENDVNIAHMVNTSRGDIAYTMMDLDQRVPTAAMQKLDDIEDLVRVRTIKSAY